MADASDAPTLQRPPDGRDDLTVLVGQRISVSRSAECVGDMGCTTLFEYRSTEDNRWHRLGERVVVIWPARCNSHAMPAASGSFVLAPVTAAQAVRFRFLFPSPNVPVEPVWYIAMTRAELYTPAKASD